MKTLSDFCADPDYFMITAHRGASFEFPENTLLSMRRAVEAGADMIEFDLRGSADQEPVLLHDETIDRTSNASGKPEEHTLSELKSYNFSYFLQGVRRETPAYSDVTIPTFEEVLAEFRDQVAMNIQVYTKDDRVLAEICRLFKKYDMYDRGYFMVTGEYVEKIRRIDSKIELCVARGWETRSKPEVLRQAKADNCRFTQPIREYSTSETYRYIRELGMRSNVFFCDDPAQMIELKKSGAQGVLTNKAHLMCRYRH